MNILFNAFRNILRQRFNSIIIVISLAIGLACISLIAMFIHRELSTDDFHKDKESIYALTYIDLFNEEGRSYYCKYGSSEYMKANFGQVEDFCRITNAGSPTKLTVKNDTYYDQPLCMGTSSNFFEFFSYKLLTNNPSTALETESSLVISDDLANKYFGSTDVLGEVITFSGRNGEEEMVVTGIFLKPAKNSQLNFDMVRLIGEKDSRCYVKLHPGAEPDELESIFEENKNIIPIFQLESPGQYYLEPFQKTYFNTKRHLSVDVSRDKNDLWIALIIGLMVMGIALFNYLGLVNNNLFCKTQEFNVRRINGSSLMDLVKRFMTENLILMSISFMLSWYLIVWIIPDFNRLTGANIPVEFVLQLEQVFILVSIVLFLLGVTFVFAFIQIRRGLRRSAHESANYRFGRKIQLPAFNIFQLASSVILIVCAIVILRQMIFITEKPIGLDKQVIEVRIPSQYKEIVPTFKDELLKVASVEAVSVTTASPVLEHYMFLLSYNDNGVDKQYTPAIFLGDENYCSTLGIRLIEGNGFSGNPSADKDRCLINESLAKVFSGQNLIGKSLPGMESCQVAGIVNDFHYSSLKRVIEPGVITYDSNGNHLLVKAKDNQSQPTHDAIAKIWAQLIPDLPINTETIGDRFEWFHRENKNHIQLIGAFSFISIFLSMIGLFAVAFQSSKHRTKEIGIRKVNGAKIWQVMLMLNTDFVKWVAIAFVIATPIAYYAMDKWLQNFAYRTQLSWWVFALAGLLALVIALLTVSWQSWLAARRNPVEALRYE